jgi:hypothetical protein
VGVLLGFAERRRALVGVLLLAGCLPRGDLAGYSEGHAQQQPGDLQVAVPALNPAPADPQGAADENGPGLGPSESETAPSLVNLAPPDSLTDGVTPGSADHAADAGIPADGGAPVLPPTEADASSAVSSPGTADAATARAEAGSGVDAACTNAGGTLEPSTRTCVFIAAEQLSWLEAVAACAADGRQLISIKSPDLDSFLTPLLSDDVWIGAHDPAMLNPASNAFVWLDGTPANGTNWAPGEPDAQLNQYCVSKTSAPPTGPWRDRPCGEAKAYVCEQAF